MVISPFGVVDKELMSRCTAHLAGTPRNKLILIFIPFLEGSHWWCAAFSLNGREVGAINSMEQSSTADTHYLYLMKLVWKHASCFRWLPSFVSFSSSYGVPSFACSETWPGGTDSHGSPKMGTRSMCNVWILFGGHESWRGTISVVNLSLPLICIHSRLPIFNTVCTSTLGTNLVFRCWWQLREVPGGWHGMHTWNPGKGGPMASLWGLVERHEWEQGSCWRAPRDSHGLIAEVANPFLPCVDHQNVNHV